MQVYEYGVEVGFPSTHPEQLERWIERLSEIPEVSDVSSHFGPELSDETEKTHANTCPVAERAPKLPLEQSALHNCPKHLIGFVNMALQIRQREDLEANNFIRETPEPIRRHVRGLCRLLYLSFTGAIRSMSRQLLKIIFQEGSERIHKLKLLSNPAVQEVFDQSCPDEMAQAKSVLRAHTILMLETKKRKLLQGSRICNKGVNKRYLELFTRELRENRIRERISKRDKQYILDRETKSA